METMIHMHATLLNDFNGAIKLHLDEKRMLSNAWGTVLLYVHRHQPHRNHANFPFFPFPLFARKRRRQEGGKRR